MAVLIIMVRILTVTGRLAENKVRENSKDMADVLVLDIDIAAFITPEMLEKHGSQLKEYDLILISGLVTADFTGVEEEIGVPIRLGSKHAFDLSLILPYAEEIEFSTETPACELLLSKKQEQAKEQLRDLETQADYVFQLGTVKIGGRSSMKIVAEIVDATKISREQLLKSAEHLINSGASIIDLGAGMDATAQEVKDAVTAVKSSFSVPVSIDTLEPELIEAGVLSGADMVLSLNSSNLEQVGELIAEHDVVAVIIPDDKTVDSLRRNINTAGSAGIKKIIADPILDPPGSMVESTRRYHEFRELDQNTPLFLGAGNVTELMDADSIGVNALIAAMGMELNASILFTTEHGDKTHGSVKELCTASDMMHLAAERETPPKDLGVDLLVVKEKRRRETTEPPSGDVIQAKAHDEWVRDPKGCVKISIDDQSIIARYGDKTVVGSTAREIVDTLLDMEAVSMIEHAAYLGRELMRAELALKLGRSYLQDDEF